MKATQDAQDSTLQTIRQGHTEELFPGKAYQDLPNNEKFKVCEHTLIWIGAMQRALNRTLMPVLWEAYLTGDWGDQPTSNFIEWALEIASQYWGDQEDYLRKIILRQPGCYLPCMPMRKRVSPYLIGTAVRLR